MKMTIRVSPADKEKILHVGADFLLLTIDKTNPSFPREGVIVDLDLRGQEITLSTRDNAENTSDQQQSEPFSPCSTPAPASLSYDDDALEDY